MIATIKRVLTRRVCLIVALLACVIAVLWLINVPLVHCLVRLPDETFTRDELYEEAGETYMKLRARGIMVVGNKGSERYNAAVVLVHPKDKYKLWLTKKDVPDERYYRLVRWNEEIPVYIEFQYPSTDLSEIS